MEYKRLSRCGIDNCKQTLFLLENGRWFCKNGHMREGELEMEADDDGFGQTGSRATREKVVEKRVVKVLRGRKGFELYIQCFQILLQKQVWWLIHEKGFPQELEVVVRDLWALRLQIVSEKLPENAANSQSQSQSQSRQPDGTDGCSSQSSSYLYTSDSDMASTTYSARRRRQRRVPKASDRPKLMESLVLCYLGLVLLRAAVSLGDMHRWVDAQGLVYIRAIREVPPAMKEKLSAEYWAALDPRARLSSDRLYRSVHETVVLLHEKFGITFPPVNREVLLARIVNDLGLPLEIYMATKRLADRLFMTFEWPALSLTKRVTQWPEAKLMALVITATKLCYGLDDVLRTPATAGEPAAAALSWPAWERFLRAGNDPRRGLLAHNRQLSPLSRDGSGGGGGGKPLLEVDVSESDVFAMTGEELDWYMDWYEKTWCVDDEEATSKLSQGILNLFPTSRPEPPRPRPAIDDDDDDENSPHARLAALHAETVAVPPCAGSHSNNNNNDDDDDDNVLRPGERYLWYSTDEEAPHQLRTLMQAAADLLAIAREDLQRVVRNVELALKGQVQEARRRKRAAAAAAAVEVVYSE